MKATVGIPTKSITVSEVISIARSEVMPITTSEHYGSRTTARVSTYREMLEEYEFHPEAKCADTNANT